MCNSFTCHPHTDHSVCTPQLQGNRPLTFVVCFIMVCLYDVTVSVAVDSLQVDIVKQLLQAGCDLNSVETDHHSTVLHRVVRYC